MNAGRSPKFNIPIARAPRIMLKFSQERKVRSFAKNTFGSTRVGRAIRFPVDVVSILSSKNWRGDGNRIGGSMYLERSGGVVEKTWRLFMFLYEGEFNVVVSEKQYLGGGLDGSLRLPCID